MPLFGDFAKRKAQFPLTYVSAIDTFESSTYLYGTLGPARLDPQHNFVIQVQQILSLPGGYFEASSVLGCCDLAVWHCHCHTVTTCSVSPMALPDCLPCLLSNRAGMHAVRTQCTCISRAVQSFCIGDNRAHPKRTGLLSCLSCVYAYLYSSTADSCDKLSAAVNPVMPRVHGLQIGSHSGCTPGGSTVPPFLSPKRIQSNGSEAW